MIRCCWPLQPLSLDGPHNLCNGISVHDDGYAMVAEKGAEVTERRQQSISNFRKALIVGFAFHSEHQQRRGRYFRYWIALKSFGLHLNIAYQSLDDASVGARSYERRCKRMGRLQDVLEKSNEDVGTPTLLAIRNLLWNHHRSGANDGRNQNLSPCTCVEGLDSGRASVLVENAPRGERPHGEAGYADRPRSSSSHSIHRLQAPFRMLPKFYSAGFRFGGRLDAH